MLPNNKSLLLMFTILQQKVNFLVTNHIKWYTFPSGLSTGGFLLLSFLYIYQLVYLSIYPPNYIYIYLYLLRIHFLHLVDHLPVAGHLPAPPGGHPLPQQQHGKVSKKI